MPHGGAQVVATASTGFDPEHDDNPDVLWCYIGVHPDHRRRGVATLLLRELVAIAEDNGRKRFISHTTERVPAGDAFATAIGGEVKSRIHTNRVLTSDVDRALMERWVAEGPSRAAGYELIGWDGQVPEEHLANWVDLVLVMNTAPATTSSSTTSTSRRRRSARARRPRQPSASKTGCWWARHIESGEWAGFHNVSWHPNEPTVVYVDSTGVRPEHRGHALGKWLKAAMQLRILDERPDVTEVRTGNADSNDAMLGINKQMGYQPFVGHAQFEIGLDKARAYLAGRG